MKKSKVSFFVTREQGSYIVKRKINYKVCKKWSIGYNDADVAFNVAEKLNASTSGHS